MKYLTYDTLILYHEHEEFTTRWQWFRRNPMLVHKDRFIWIDNRVIAIPTEDGDKRYFDNQYLIRRRNGNIIMGVLQINEASN